MLQYLQQNQANLNPQQQAMLAQLTHQYRLSQQYKAQAITQQSGMPQPQQQQAQQGVRQFQQGGFQQPDGQRTPISGTVAQTGFVPDGSFSPATGHTQQAAGMPFKSAATGYQQGQFNTGSTGFTQISSTTTTPQANASSSDLGKFLIMFCLCSLFRTIDKSNSTCETQKS